MIRHKNKLNQPLVIIGYGNVAAGAEFEAAERIENPNIEVISDTASITPNPQPPVNQDVIDVVSDPEINGGQI